MLLTEEVETDVSPGVPETRGLVTAHWFLSVDLKGSRCVVQPGSTEP